MIENIFEYAAHFLGSLVCFFETQLGIWVIGFFLFFGVLRLMEDMRS